MKTTRQARTRLVPITTTLRDLTGLVLLD